MIKFGLTSVTFRSLSPEKIIEIVRQAGLDAIEWGGDVHLPPSDTARVKNIAQQTLEAGLAISSYGSYFILGKSSRESFKDVLETACVLNAPTIRVWAGNKASGEADEGHWKMIVEESREIAKAAADCDINIAYEHHRGTLADKAQSVVRLLERVDCPNFKTYWQPQKALSPSQNYDELKTMTPWLENVHVFYEGESCQMRLLAEGSDDWAMYFSLLRKCGHCRYALLEFVKDDKVENFFRDAKTLKSGFTAQGRQ